MSEFRNLGVYQKTRAINRQIGKIHLDPQFPKNYRDQLQRASASILLNIAEGSGRFARKDQRHFFITARASAMECIAILDLLEDLNFVAPDNAEEYRKSLEEITKMLFGMIRNLKD